MSSPFIARPKRFLEDLLKTIVDAFLSTIDSVHFSTQVPSDNLIFSISLNNLGKPVDFTYPRNMAFKCLKCSLCCGNTKTHARHILLLKKEVNRISEKTSKPIEEFAKRIEGHEPYVYEMNKNAETGKCIFLEQNRCTVYALRPIICRFYPFELKVTKDGEHEFDFTVECPGIGKGKALRKDYFDGLFLQLSQGVE